MSGRVPPSSRARKRKSPRLLRSDVERAANLYESFSGHDPEMLGRFKIPSLPKVAMLLGKLDFVGYSTVRDGRAEKYIHKFKASDRPYLAVSPDGKQLLVIGGAFEMTELGIVDVSDTKHAWARRS